MFNIERDIPMVVAGGDRAQYNITVDRVSGVVPVYFPIR